MKGLIRSRRGKYGGVSVALTVLTLVAVIIFNIILSVLSTRYEWMYANMNSNTVFSVSETCESYLAEHVFPRVDEINKNLTELGEEKQKIKIVFCEDKDSILAEQSQKYVHDSVFEVIDMFPEYFEVEYINIWETPSLAREYGATSTSDVVCMFGDRRETMTLSDFYIYSVEDSTNTIGYNGEKIIASCLMRLTQENSPLCYFTANHGESFDDYEFMRTVVEAGYTVAFIDLANEDIPADCELLITFDPKQDFMISNDVSGISEIAKLDAFMDRGGKYMIFLSSDTFASGKRENLEGFLARRGIVYDHKTGDDGVENCNVIKDTAHSLTVNGYTVVAENATEGEGKSVMNGLPKNNVFGSTTSISFSSEFKRGDEGELTATVDGRKIKVFPLMQSHSSAEAWAGGKAIARASENPFTLMAMSTQECEDGKTAYLVASASTEFASEALMQSTGAGNSKTLMGIIRYMGKDNAPVELVYRPFGSTEMAGITTRTANILTVTLTAIPALICLVWGAVVLIRRKNV